MSVLWFMLEPLDVTLFRDGRPFTPGESSFARSLFPPNPSTIAGAMRTFIGRELLGGQFSKLGNAEYAPMLFEGPYPVARDGDQFRVYFPWPADLAKHETFKDEKNAVYERRSLMAYPNYFVRSNPRFSRGLVLRGRCDVPPDLPDMTRYIDDHGRAWMDSRGLRQWCSGSPFYRVVTQRLTIVQDEPRPGIRMDAKTLTVDPEGNAFFFAQMNRYEDGTGFIVGMEQGRTDPDLWTSIEAFHASGESRILSLGGERRMARVMPVPIQTIGMEEPPQTLNGTVRLLLLTPAMITLENDRLTVGEEADAAPAALLAHALTGAPGFYTGWDYVERGPKAHRRLVPAGTVMVLRIHGDRSVSARGSIGDITTLGFGRYIAIQEEAND